MGQRERQGHGHVGPDDPQLASGHRDARLAPAVNRVEGGGLGRRAHGDAEVDVAQVAVRPGELELVGVAA
ncbi:MAG: hypothetical protein M3P37_08480, partial [Actinomycetota bacterium]|nr:hypothetical protein [Actinomycetota bacterium]